MIYEKYPTVSIAKIGRCSASVLAVAVLSLGIGGCGGGEEKSQQPQAIAWG